MYQFSYADVQEDDVTESKDRERQVLDRSIDMLRNAMKLGGDSQEAIEAIYYTNRVWVRLIEDLGSEENQLDEELRANLISIGIWIIKESERIRHRESNNFQGIIDITTMIRDGLK
ncbi:MAG: flagellar biosynthesis regulator FlaF [Lentilitoribacter sp.]|jgi:flagellar protein FlaF